MMHDYMCVNIMVAIMLASISTFMFISRFAFFVYVKMIGIQRNVNEGPNGREGRSQSAH